MARRHRNVRVDHGRTGSPTRRSIIDGQQCGPKLRALQPDLAGRVGRRLHAYRTAARRAVPPRRSSSTWSTPPAPRWSTTRAGCACAASTCFRCISPISSRPPPSPGHARRLATLRRRPDTGSVPFARRLQQVDIGSWRGRLERLAGHLQLLGLQPAVDQVRLPSTVCVSSRNDYGNPPCCPHF